MKKRGRKFSLKTREKYDDFSRREKRRKIQAVIEKITEEDLKEIRKNVLY